MLRERKYLIICRYLVSMGRKAAYCLMFVLLLATEALAGAYSCRQGECDVVIAPACQYAPPVVPTRTPYAIVTPERLCVLPLVPERKCVRYIKEQCPQGVKPGRIPPPTCGVR